MLMSAEQFKTPNRGVTLDFDRLDDEARKLLLCNVNRFGLSVRARNILANAGLRLLGEAVQVTEAEWFRFQNCGRKTVNEIRNLASRLGLALGTVILNWPAGRLDELTASDTAITDNPGDWAAAEVPQAYASPAKIDFSCKYCAITARRLAISPGPLASPRTIRPNHA